MPVISSGSVPGQRQGCGIVLFTAENILIKIKAVGGVGFTLSTSVETMVEGDPAETGQDITIMQFLTTRTFLPLIEGDLQQFGMSS